MGTLGQSGPNIKTKKNLNETDMLQVSLTLSTGAIRLPSSYFRFRATQWLAVFKISETKYHILGAK